MADKIVHNYTKITEILNFHYINKIQNKKKTIKSNTDFCEEIYDYEYNEQTMPSILAQCVPQDSWVCMPSRLIEHGTQHDTIGSILSRSVSTYTPCY